MYHIHRNGASEGPFDLMSLVRKLKKQAIQADTLISRDGQPPQPASQLEELRFHFHPEEEDAAPVHHAHEGRPLHFGQALKSGFVFLTENTAVTVPTGILLLGFFLVMGLVAQNFLLGYLAAALLTGPVLGAYSYYTLRLSRGQPIDWMVVLGHVRRNLPALIPAGALLMLLPSVCVDLMFGGSGASSAGISLVVLVLCIVSLFVFAFYIFTPLLIVDRNLGCWGAMEASRQRIMQGGIELISVIFGLMVMNFVGLALLVLPMVVTMPITSGALTHLYDHLYAHDL